MLIERRGIGTVRNTQHLIIADSGQIDGEKVISFTEYGRRTAVTK